MTSVQKMGLFLTTLLLVEGKVRKFGLKLRIEKTKVVTNIWQRTFLENCKKIFFQLNFLKEPEKQGLS